MQDECDTLKAELKIKDNHINRYKKELEDALDRERALEEAKEQLDIDWQKKIDQNQRQEYHKSEDLIGKLSTAHEQVRLFCFSLINENLCLPLGISTSEKTRK